MKYNKMPLDFNGITCKFKDTTSPYSKSNPHKGLDLGWNKYQGEPVYAINDGTVIDVDYSTGDSNAGWYVWIRHSFDDKNELICRYCHLKEKSIKVNKNDKVKRGQLVASMGGTFGYATHLHFEMWKVPKGWKFNWNDRSKYLVNPLDYTFAFDGQTIHKDDTSLITRVLGTSKQVKRDTTKNQIEVIGYQLRCRKNAGTNQEILGFIDYGIYNYSDTSEANGYTWYKLDFGWIAGLKEDTKVYKKEKVINTEATDCSEELNIKINELEKIIEEQNNIIENLKNNNSKYKEYICSKEFIYLKLMKNDVIYFKEPS